MEIIYKTKELQKCAEIDGYAQKKLGKQQADKFLRRVGTLIDAESFEDLRHVPGRFHELTENRKGQWAFDLVQPSRLIVTPKTRPIATNSQGKFIWSLIQDAIIVEIVDYHKKG